MTETDAAIAPTAADDMPPACQNCGTPLLGPHCYKCGQPVNGLVRHFSSIVGDFADSVLNIDARVFRTLWPLFAKPGYLSREYFAGRRVRYVSPVRLFVFLSIVTFFVAQLMINFDSDVVRVGDGQRSEASAKGDDDIPRPSFNGRDWDATTNPVDIGWLPAFGDRWINAQIGHGLRNFAEMKKNPERFKEHLIGALPSTLFVLLPIFALMLKILYLFKRRLYMEHLIIALHSHAFLCLDLLLVFAVDALSQSVPAVSRFCGFAELLLFLWMPLYLLLMQKRVYGQGWVLTLLKYCVLGISYTLLLSIGMVGTVLASILWM